MKSLIIAFIILFGIAATAVYYPIQTDATLTGDGTVENPLAVASSFSSAKVAVTDTATMLAHFVERADTSTMLGKYILRSGRSGGQTIVGGSGTTDDLILQSTRGVGATGAEMQFKVGNNGATRAMTILNSGLVGIGPTITTPLYNLDIDGSIRGLQNNTPGFTMVNLNNTSYGIGDFIGTNYGINIAANNTTSSYYLINIVSGATVSATNFTGGTSRLRMLNNGRLGIATTLPDALLELNLGTADAFRLTYNDANGSAANYCDMTISSVGSPTFNATGTSPTFTFSDPVLFDGYARLKAYTVGTLPTGVTGAMAYVTDATAPTYLGALTGGGSVKCPVFYNGSAWVSH